MPPTMLSCFLTIPDRLRRCNPGLPVVLDDGIGPPGQLFLLAAGQEVILGVPAAIPDLGIGDQQPLTIDVQE